MKRSLPWVVPAFALVLAVGQVAGAQEAAETPAESAPAAGAAATADPVGAAGEVATVSPVETPDATAVRAVVEEEIANVRDELAYRSGRMRRKITRNELSAADRADVEPEIERAIKRAGAEIEGISAGKATDDIKAISRSVVADLEEAQDWTERAAEDFDEAAADLDGAAAQALKESADELEALAESLEESAERIEDAAAEQLAVGRTSSGGQTIEIGDEGVRVRGEQGVRFGGSLHVKEGETVNEAVAFGGSVRVDGTVEGDAVAFGGSVDVGPTGVIEGEAVSFGGRVNVDEGGQVHGEKTSLGPSFPSHFFDNPRRNLPWSARVGMRLVNILAKFLVLFALTLLGFGLLPKRMAVVVDTLETRPLVSGGFGLLTAIAAVLLCALLTLTCVGALLVPPVAIVLAGGALMGFAALTMSLGRRLPIPVGPSNAAYAAIGAVVIVVVTELIPVLGPLALIAACAVGLGAVALTRFGQNQAPEPGRDDEDAYEKAIDEVNGVE